MLAWTDSLDRQLLLAVISVTSPSPPKWDLVAEHMGEGFTSEAVRQHYAKIVKQEKTANNPAVTEPGSKKLTTSAKKATGLNSVKGGRKRGKAASGAIDNDDESNNEEDGSGARSKKNKIKKEHEQVSEEDDVV